jgi:hypothetical protein
MSGLTHGEIGGATGLEPATYCVTGWRSNHLNYAPANEPSALQYLALSSRSMITESYAAPERRGRIRIRLIVKLTNG